jgi:hypothetical protein
VNEIVRNQDVVFLKKMLQISKTAEHDLPVRVNEIGDESVRSERADLGAMRG